MSRARRISAARFEEIEAVEHQEITTNEVVNQNSVEINQGAEITIQSDQKEVSEIDTLKAKVDELTSALLALTVKVDKSEIAEVTTNEEVKTDIVATEIAEGVTITN